jgi:hypothetical protein
MTMRKLAPIVLALVLLLPAAGAAGTWRPPFLDVGDELISMGPTKIIDLLGFDPEREVITHLSLSPDGHYAALVTKNGQSLTIQVVNLILRGKQTRLALGEAAPGREDRFVQWAANSQCLMVTQAKGRAGERIAVMPAPFKTLTMVETDGAWECPILSPDGERVAYRTPPYFSKVGEAYRPGIYYHDLAANQAVFCGDGPGLGSDWQIASWPDDNRILLVNERELPPDEGGRRRGPGSPYELISLNLVDHSETVQPIPWKDLAELSPDGKYYCDFGVPNVYVVADRRALNLSKDMELRPFQWDPQGRFLLAWHQDPIKDEMDRVHKELANLWLLKLPEANADTGLVARQDNRFLVAVDAEPDPGFGGEAMAAIAGDGRSIIYIADNQLRAKALKRLHGAAASAAREEYERTLQAQALSNAKQIAVALLMYSDDWDGALPAPDGVVESLTDYCRTGDIFQHPELPEMMCFEYRPPGHLRLDGIPDPANTAIGWLDWGRGWQVFIYADGHCKVVEGRARPGG